MRKSVKSRDGCHSPGRFRNHLVRLNRGTDGDSYPQHPQRPGDAVTEESHRGVDERPGVSARSEVFLQILLCQWSQDGPEA